MLSTYNEAENIVKMIGMTTNALQKLSVPYKIVVVDANSPDGTSKIVKQMNHPHVEVVDEACKRGLGASYKTGIEYCKYGYTVIIDSDLQHDPNAIIQMFQLAISKKYDIVTGTRYSQSGMVSNWPFKRKFISSFANNFARNIIGLKTTDITGCFRLYRTEILKKLLSNSYCNGFGIQLELIARSESMKYKIGEVPITFYDRIAGMSKLQAHEIFLFLKAIITLYFVI